MKMYNTQNEKQKAFMVYVSFNTKEDVNTKISELKSLIQANNLDAVGNMVQFKKEPDLSYLIGIGKLEELKAIIDSESIDLVVFQNSLSGSKINNLETYLGVKVIDRTMLILDIFAQRATSNEGKLQVELAQLKYTLPRLSGLSGSSGRFGSGGVGMRGPGETKLELDRRKIEKQIQIKQKEIKELEKNREVRKRQRANSYYKTVSLVGYTNSGKSTLMNTLSKSDVFIKDMLFATLDTTTRKLYLNENLTVLLTDTVGFVSDLPHELVEAFKSTLEESVSSDLLIHVVDCSDPMSIQKEQITLDVLKSLNVDLNKIITVYNKMDKPHLFDPERLYISAKNNINLDKVREKIIEFFGAETKEDEY